MKIILLSGGSGKRLWPLSNDVRSKQFIKIFRTEDGYESMAQRVYRQIRSACQDISVTVATSKPQVSTIINQLGDKVDICVEPARRDTFPAITLACQYLKDVESVSGDETILVCPVDSYVEDDFFSSIIKAAEEEDSVPDKGILLLGVEPTYPSSKYGYIIPEGGKHESESVGNVCKGYSRAISYVEKPSEEDAALLISKGALWSSGIFAFKLDYMLERAHELIDYKDYDDLYSRYGELRKISFDYAVIENETSLRVVRYKGPWTDLGTWNTMSNAMEAPVIGKAIISDSCQNVHVLNDMDVPVLCMGLKDVIITTSPEGILVSDKEQSSKIKPYVDRIRQQVRFAQKSWGEFRVLDVSDEGLTIKVTLKPGHRMNYHSHQYRDEVWTVISGSGRTIVDGMEQPITPGDVITMQAGCKHTVIADTELTLIEVQLGKNISVSDKKKYDLE
ncbi:MAG TPA: mannose-1-phosphate guanylyltransferase [Lachnospiraceae bacterium]|nr:mannose-1-phosphate guanylyltransferase [Lachnospiraceae bacterium]